MPALPTWEDEQTILPCSILDGLDDDVVSNIIEDTYGRIQIMDGKILRDMPEGQSKANISLFNGFRNIDAALIWRMPTTRWGP